jgi:hypothetical protein
MDAYKERIWVDTMTTIDIRLEAACENKLVADQKARNWKS